ncbi:MAG: phosphatase [Oscillospiraceae bacterium]
MKKSTLFTGTMILAAVAGALAAGYVYLYKREKELDEYEQLLFSEEFTNPESCEGCTECDEDDSEVEELDF